MYVDHISNYIQFVQFDVMMVDDNGIGDVNKYFVHQQSK